MPLTEEQILNRKTGIGASESACVMNMSKWSTPYDIYLRKTHLEYEDVSSEAAHFGNLLEETVAQEYARRTGVTVRRNNKTLRHSKYPFMLCHLDRVVTGEKKIVECKTASEYLLSSWGEEGTDQIPEEYIIQVHHQMAVTGIDIADIPVLIGGNKLKIYTVHKDDELIDIVISAVVDFWENHVLKGIPPDIDCDHPQTGTLLKRIYPGTDGSEIDLGPSAEHWHQIKLEAAEKVKSYQGVVDGAKNHLLEMMGNSAIGKLPDGGQYTRSVTKRKGFTVEPTEYTNFRFKKG